METYLESNDEILKVNIVWKIRRRQENVWLIETPYKDMQPTLNLCLDAKVLKWKYQDNPTHSS